MTIDELIERGVSARTDLARSLVASGRVFPNGWWHGSQIDVGIELMQSVLAGELLLDVCLPVAALTSFVEERAGSTVDDEGEDELRRQTIALAVEHLNQQLAATDSQLYGFEEFQGWEQGEPVWLLLNHLERRDLLATGLLSAAQST